MKAKDIQDKVKALYANVEPGHFQVKDTSIINWQIAAKNRMADPDVVAKLKESRKKQNTDEYREYMRNNRLDAIDKPYGDTGMTLREYLTKANQLSAKDPVAQKNRTKANRSTRKKKYWKDAHAKGVLKYSIEYTTPQGVFSSGPAWGKHMNRCKDSCANLCKRFPHLYYKTEEGPGEPTYVAMYYTEFGRFYNMVEAYQIAKKNKQPLAMKNKNVENWFIKLCRDMPKKYYKTWEIPKFEPRLIDNKYKLSTFSKEKADVLRINWKNKIG